VPPQSGATDGAACAQRVVLMVALGLRCPPSGCLAPKEHRKLESAPGPGAVPPQEFEWNGWTVRVALIPRVHAPVRSGMPSRRTRDGVTGFLSGVSAPVRAVGPGRDACGGVVEA